MSLIEAVKCDRCGNHLDTSGKTPALAPCTLMSFHETLGVPTGRIDLCPRCASFVLGVLVARWTRPEFQSLAGQVVAQGERFGEDEGNIRYRHKDAIARYVDWQPARVQPEASPQKGGA